MSQTQGKDETSVSVHDYVTGPCPLYVYAAACGGKCPEPFRCAIDRAAHALGKPHRVVIDPLTYEARRG